MTVLLGIWRVGGVYVPLFTAFAADAVASRLEGADAKVVIADAAQSSKVPEGAWTVLIAEVDGSERSLSGCRAAAEPFAGSTPVGGDGAFVHMFTSGTTGAPKGVVQPLRYVAGLAVVPGVRPGSAGGLGLLVRSRPRLGLRAVLGRRDADGAGSAQRAAARRVRRRGHLSGDGGSGRDRLHGRSGVPEAARERRAGARRVAPAAVVQRGGAVDR